MRRVFSRVRARVFRVVAVAVPVTVVVGVLGQGQGFPVTSHPMDSGSAWFASLSVGQVTLIDGPSRQAVTQVDVAEPGAAIHAVQAGTGAYVTNQSTGTVTHVDGATYSPSEAVALIDGAGRGLQVFAGDRWVYVLDRQRGAVVAADKTLRSSQAPASLAAFVADGTVDGDGRLWVLDGASGDLISLDDSGRNAVAGLVDPAGADLELAGDRLAVIDQTARTIHVVDPRSREIVDEVCIDVAAGDQTVRVAGSRDAPRVHVVSGQRGVLLTSDLQTGDCSSFVQVADPGASLGVPQEAGGRVFVPDFSTGQVHIVDLSDGDVTADADVFDGPTQFELLARNGIVFYNDPYSQRAGVIDLDGTVHAIDKYDDRGDQPKDTPGRGDEGDTGDDEQDDDGNGNDDDGDGNDKDNERDDRGQDDDRDEPDSDRPGGTQALQPLEPRPDAGVPQRLPDFDLPPAPTGDVPQTPGDTGGINPPIGGDPTPQPPDQPPTDDDPPPSDDVEPPIALIGCTDSSPTAGDELQCNWMVPAAGPDDPPGTSYGGPPDTWDWHLTGPEEATGTGAQFNHTMTAPGTYQLALTVANAAGTDTASRTITVSPALAPPSAQFTCNRTSMTAGDRLQCTWSGNGGTPDSWNWRLTLPLLPDVTATGTTFTRTMASAGTFQLSLTVANAAGTDTTTRTITVSAAPEPPRIDAVSCSPAGPHEVGDAVTCTAATSGTVDRLLWSWTPPSGPGGYSKREQPSLRETLAVAGLHFVTVYAQGAGEETSKGTSVMAQAPPPPPPPSITSMSCHSPGGLGNQDPPVWFGGQVLTCSVNASGQVDSHDWTMNPGGVNRSGQTVQFGLPSQPPGGREPHRVDVTVSGPGGSDTTGLDFIVRACDNHPDPPCAHR